MKMKMKMNQVAALCRRVSQSTIKPKHILQVSQKLEPLTPWELSFLGTDYIKLGLLFPKPEAPVNSVIRHLQNSLSTTLTHFPSLTGCLVTKTGVHPPSLNISLDCTNPQGADFIHAVADHVTLSDVLSHNQDIPKFLPSLFPLKGAINHDGHTKPMLAVQVTELVDGIFIACCVNHSVVDGCSFWHFLNTWSDISRTNDKSISCPPTNRSWFLDGANNLINLPYSHHDEFINRYPSQDLRDRIFHFSAKSVSRLKARANAEAGKNYISSFQALSAFVWKCTTRIHNLVDDQVTLCSFLINDRSRLSPRISDNYFGNYAQVAVGAATAGEIMDNNLGWSASLLHVAIANHTDEKVRAWLKGWEKNPIIYPIKDISGPFLLVGNSPRFNVYGNDFGWGKPLGVRTGSCQKFDGMVLSYPGREEEGSVDLEISLSHESMTALLLDDEFMGAVA